MNNPTSSLEQAQRRIGTAGMMGRVRGAIVCVLALILLFLTVGVGVRSISAAEARFAPTGIVAPNTATLSPDPNSDGGNEDVAQVTLLRARFKAH